MASPAPSLPRSWLKAFLPRTLFSRALLILLLPVLLAQGAAVYVFFQRHWQTVTHRLTYAVAGDIGFLVNLIERQGFTDTIVQQAAYQMDLALTFNPTGTIPVLHRPWLAPLQSALEVALTDRLTYKFAVDRELSPEFFAVYVQMPQGLLKVISPERRIYTPTTQVFIFIMLGSSLLLTFIAIIFMRNQVRPIRRLAAAATAFGKGLDMPDFKPEGAQEVRQAARALLVMRERLQRQLAQRTEMLSGVSHDLRTPLTRMKLELALLPASPEVDGLKKDIAEMTAMLDAYLAFARGEGGEQAINCDITALVSDVVEQVQRHHQGVMWIPPVGPCWLAVRPQAMRRCLSNLLANATRYGTEVQVRLELSDTQLVIAVADNGPGIAPEQREQVFKPFMRLEQARTANPAGLASVGLGLTIARDLARAHGGDIVLETSNLGGLLAKIVLPR